MISLGDDVLAIINDHSINMPEALATTKRKFYKALDALTNSATTTTTTTHDSHAVTNNNKRTLAAAAAFDEARERARKRLRQSTSSTSLGRHDGGSSSIISLPRSTPVKLRPKSGTELKPPPNFSPWSQETFLARLKTYSSVSTWHPKPDPISEVEWAKRGWVCVDVNTVACRGGCERRVVVNLETSKRTHASGAVDEGDRENDDDDDDDDAEAGALEEALAERYKDEIVNGHSSSCMWRKAGCKNDIYRLPVVRPSVWQPELSKRYRSLLSIGSSIDRVKTKVLESTTAPEKFLKDLPQEVVDPSDTTHQSSAKALEIALHGWRGTSISSNDLLQCDACFQRVGLWMYQPDYLATRRRPSVNEDDADDEVGIDLIEMHREHCPWRNATSQKATGSLIGLNAAQILQRVAATAARDHRRRSHEPVWAVGADDAEDVAGGVPALAQTLTLTRAEVAQQDKERESRMSKLKNLFNIKRKSTSALSTRNAA